MGHTILDFKTGYNITHRSHSILLRHFLYDIYYGMPSSGIIEYNFP